MILQHLYEIYGLSCHFDRTSTGTWLRSGEWTIYPTPRVAFQESSIEALASVSQHLLTNGDHVARILITKNGEYSSMYEGEEMVFLAAQTEEQVPPWDGERMASFHELTHFDQTIYSTERPYLNWAVFWQNRADQVYAWIEDRLKSEEPTAFEQAMIEQYPYYSGRAENAIQYVVDLMIDAHVDEGAGFCHNRIRSTMWKQEQGEIQWPTEWVIDHPGRDIGEWLRSVCWEAADPEREGLAFLERYKRKKDITQVGMSLAYARLLFPFPFFETVEGYFAGQFNEEDALKKLDRCLKMSVREEALLSRFSNLGLTPVVEVDWLKTQATH